MPPEGQAAEQPAVPNDTTIHEAALRILQAEDAPAAEAKKPPVPEEKTPETAQPEEKPETEEAPEPKAAETETEETPQPPRTHKLRVKTEDGSDVDVEVDDDTLKRGYMMERDYRAKTAQLAREREAVDAKVRESVEPKVKEYSERLQVFEKAIWQALAPEIQNVDWNKLAREDPATWAQKMQAVNNVNGLLQAVQQENARLHNDTQAKARESKAKEARAAVEELQRDIPGWNNEIYGKILKAGQEYGYKSAELNELTDPRAIKVLWKAMRYDDLQKAKPAVEKRVTTVPKVAKPGTAEKPDASADQWKQGLARLRKSGRTEDALGLAKMLIKD